MKLENIAVTGDKKYAKKVQAEINRILKDPNYQNAQAKKGEVTNGAIEITESKKKLIDPLKGRVTPVADKKELSSVTEIKKGIAQVEDRIKASNHKHDLEDLKKLDANLVIKWAEKNLQLEGKHYVVTEDNKINDVRTGAAPKTTIDFVKGTCNQTFSESLVVLENVKAAEEQRLKKIDSVAKRIDKLYKKRTEEDVSLSI
jgi:hypothetical protein